METIEVETNKNNILLKPKVDITKENSKTATLEIISALTGFSKHVILDLQKMYSFDVYGIKIIISMNNSLAKNNRTLTIVTSPESTINIFKAIRLNDYINIS